MEFSVVVLAVGGLLSLLTIIGLAVKLTWFISSEFSKARDLLYKLHRENGARILRLEMWAVRRGFQPGIDPLDRLKIDGDGSDKTS